MVADRVFLDSNVLLAATDHTRSAHAAAVAALEQWPAAGTTLYASGQVLREYLVVATRPVEVNGLGLSSREAWSNAAALRARLRLLDEDVAVNQRLLEIGGTTEIVGKQIHDANLVATMLVHGLDTLATDNLQHFARYRDLVTVLPLQPRSRCPD